MAHDTESKYPLLHTKAFVILGIFLFNNNNNENSDNFSIAL